MDQLRVEESAEPIKRICRNKYCYFPDTPCDNGDAHTCPDLLLKAENKNTRESEQDTTVQGRDSNESKEADNVSVIFPWHGRTLGLDDIRFLAVRSQLRIVGLFGTYNTGKTTFLATLYLLLMNGIDLEDKSFAGSLTLNAWETLAHSLTLPGRRFLPGEYPHFPHHTKMSNTSIPGLLHLAFRNKSGGIKDYLFTDPPGEWFERWATNENDPTTEGAQWMARYSTAIAIFVDSEALVGPQRGEESSRLSSLMLRIASTTSGQSVALVWTKADIIVKTVIRDRLENEFQRYFRERQTQIFYVAAIPKDESTDLQRGHGVLETVNWLMAPNERNTLADTFAVEQISRLMSRG